MPRYRFGEFTLSPQRRVLLRNGQVQPLIPRYFVLLLFLIEHRGKAVHRREIFDSIWSDVVVSDSALSQGIRTIRRVLGDDPREPRFLRTVSRHGYQFVFPDVVEEDEDGNGNPGVQPAAVSARTGNDAGLASQPGTGDSASDTARRAVTLPSWARAAFGGGVSGLFAGAAGALILVLAPDGTASMPLVPVLAVVGACCGTAGGAGVGAGLAIVSALRILPGAVAVILGGALGGGLVGSAAQWLGRWSLAALVGLDIPVGGGVEGLAIGGAAGLGLALVPDVPAARTGFRRWSSALVTAMTCGLAALALALGGRVLVGGTIHAIAQASLGAQAVLTPLARLFGEPAFGPFTAALISAGEGAIFGFGLALALGRSGPGEPAESVERRVGDRLVRGGTPSG